MLICRCLEVFNRLQLHLINNSGINPERWIKLHSKEYRNVFCKNCPHSEKCRKEKYPEVPRKEAETNSCLIRNNGKFGKTYMPKTWFIWLKSHYPKMVIIVYFAGQEKKVKVKNCELKEV